MNFKVHHDDEGFDRVFVEQLKNLAGPGDLLIAISGSGNSPNVLAAARTAAGAGMKVVAMTGAAGGALGELADLCFRAPAERTDLVQQLHQLAYHVICEVIDEHFSRDG